MEVVKTLGHGAVKARGLRQAGQSATGDSAPLLKLTANHIVDQGRLVVSLWGHYAGVVVLLQGSRQDMVGLSKTSSRQQLMQLLATRSEMTAGNGKLVRGCPPRGASGPWYIYLSSKGHRREAISTRTRVVRG